MKAGSATTMPASLAGDLAAASLSLARQFAAGATMWCLSPSWPSHAHHLAVEFVHPVIVGKRALPAVVLPADLGAEGPFLWAAPGDVVAIIGAEGAPGTGVTEILARAADHGVTSLWMGAGARPGGGPAGGARSVGGADHLLWLEGGPGGLDRLQASLGFVRLYHLLWELAHVCFEHPGLLSASPAPSRPAAPEPTSFLYPFIEAEERDATPLLADLARSAMAKWDLSEAVRLDTLAHAGGQIEAAASAVATCLANGGRVFTLGNGGSSTDADALAQLFARPPWGRPIPARSLADDQAVLTALSNDIGFDVVFARQLMAHGRPGDVVVAFSTSGGSENVLVALAEARRRGLVSVGLAGYDGGRMAASADLDHCLIARSDSVHRIQEAQTAVANALWSAVQAKLGLEQAPVRQDEGRKAS